MDEYLSGREHQWVPPKIPIKWEHCAVCGIIKRADGQNSKWCKGVPRIGPRTSDSANPQSSTGE